MASQYADRKSDPVRVAFVVSSLNMGGMETLLVDLVNGLDRRRFRPTLVVLHTGTLIPRLREDVVVFQGLLRWGGDVRVLPRLARVFRAQSPSIVDVFARDDAAFWGRLAAKLCRVPVTVESIHHGRFLGRRDRKLMAYHRVNQVLDPWTNAFVAVSKAQRSFWSGIGLPADRTNVIHNGIDMERFNLGPGTRCQIRRQLGFSSDVPIVGMIANFTPDKRHDLLLEALASVHAKISDVQCILVGDGMLRPRIEAMAAEFSLLPATIRFLGSRQDVPQLLAAMDVCVLPSDTESFSNALVEAMAAGLPVVSTNCGGPSEIVVDGETGFLVPCGRPEALAEKILLLLQDTALAWRMGQAGRHRARLRFGLSRMVADREALFSRLLRAQASGAAFGESSPSHR